MNGNANSAVMTADPVAIATVISGAAPSIMRWASAWGPSLCRATASSAVRERSARPWAAIAKPAAKYAAAAASTAGSWPPAGRHGCPGAGPNPRAASTAPAAARLRASWAALSATRCGGAFWAGCTASVTAARSRTATGQPQYSSAAKPVVTDRAGASIRDRPGITTGQISPATIIMATTQNTGCLTSTPAPRSRTAATRMAPVPAEVTTARWSHGGEPTRGPAYRVSLRSFMVSSRAAGASSGQGAPRLDALPHRVTANLHLPQPYAHYPLPPPSPSSASGARDPGHPDAARAAAAAGPSRSSTASPSSPRTGTPSACALSSLEPGLSPATTKLVFFDTEPATFPPSSVIAWVASSLL